MADSIPMTAEGKKKLEEELKYLLSVERPKNIAAIEEARAHGDISENAEFDSAKERQGFLEGRIGELNSKIARAQVIDPSSIVSDRVVFGATVELEDVETGTTKTYQIVGADESDISKGKISISSPLAIAVIGKSAGDEIVVKAPKGPVTYAIISVQYK